MVIVIAISTANVRTVINAVNSNNQTNLSLESIETMSSEESGSGGCYAGGRGSNECSIQAGIDIVGQWNINRLFCLLQTWILCMLFCQMYMHQRITYTIFT